MEKKKKRVKFFGLDLDLVVKRVGMLFGMRRRSCF